MPSINVDASQALYGLLLGAVLFVSAFVLIVQLLPREMYNPYKEYVSTVNPSDIKSGQFNAFTYDSNFTLSESTGTTKVYFNSTEIQFEYIADVIGLTKEQNGSLFSVRHFEWYLWIIPSGHDLSSAESIPFDYDSNPFGRIFSNRWILRFYDNATDTSTFSVKCDHITLRLTLTSNSSSYTLPNALKNRAPLRVLVSWSYDFASMGANIWTVLGSILTFQTIATGVTVLDAVLNSLISIPLWTAILYIGYRLITGLIPTLSGGGGQ